MPETKAKHINQFEKDCHYFLELLGLQRWEVVFTHEPDEDARSSCLADPQSGLAVINLATEWGEHDPLDEHGLKSCAFHEVLELLLWDLRVMLRPYYAEELINEKLHIIIRTLENAYI